MNDITSTQKNTQHEGELLHYIAEAIQIIGSVRKLATIAEVSERSVYAWKNGERFPSRANINKISEYLEGLADKNYHIETPNPLRGLRECLGKPYQRDQGIRGQSVCIEPLMDSPCTLQERDDQPSLYEQARAISSYQLPKGKVHLAKEQANCNADFVFIEKAEAKPSAGGGSLETSAQCESTYAFRLDWILQKTHSSNDLRMMEVAGRSMENTLHNGDLILVDERDKRLVEDRIYVLRVHDEIYIKRFSKTPGFYHFRGDNRELDYQDITINLHNEDLDWTIIGRAIWAGKEL
ncbi:MAG: LexA family transcriptional regulator [Pseudomonadota bacterium]